MTAIEIIGVILATSHVLTVALIVLWFGLNKPKNLATFRQRFRAAVIPARTRSTASLR
jgi:hypothetical protein